MTTIKTHGATALPDYPEAGADDARPRILTQALERVDHTFRGVVTGSGTVVVMVMGLVAVFLTVRSVQALGTEGVGAFLTTQDWSPETGHFGIAAILTGTVLIALVALAIAFPLSVATALFITQLAGDRGSRLLTTVVDLMAAVPSVVYGIWGLSFLEPVVVPFARWLSTWFGWIPLFAVPNPDAANPLPNDALYTSSTFVAGLVVGLMIVPIMTSIMRESFARAPQGEREGAFALGATRWGMIRTVVLPFGRGGVIGGTMLGMGRALGETIAIYLIISPIFQFNFHILSRGTNSIAALIALRYGEASGVTLSALMAAGLALFVLTMIVNFSASAIIARSRSGADAEA
ncbi:MAG: phosphate ABC transporter permease subunit PstC [Microbacteriaceae bacterium]|nr:phosphate ABC transporter permease subunit PstC [Microbacteriaceae bacterium]MCL2794231.1 phosphate ABC transporter permease subunit PstC [Microbacteriaceae bacterium]